MRVNRAVIASAVGMLVAAVVYRRSQQCRKRREPFLPLIGLAITAAVGAASITGADKKVQEKVWKEGKAAAEAVTTYAGRVWDGSDWSCPAGTVETGWENAKACINSQFHPPVWKFDGKTWDHHCPAGTVPTGDAVWEKKCRVGWTYRQLIDGKWQCPEGTQDSGKSWDNSQGNEGHMQCKRGRAYTLRINKDGKWVCPDGTKDTGRSWDHKTNGWDQCKWTGP